MRASVSDHSVKTIAESSPPKIDTEGGKRASVSVSGPPT